MKLNVLNYSHSLFARIKSQLIYNLKKEEGKEKVDEMKNVNGNKNKNLHIQFVNCKRNLFLLLLFLFISDIFNIRRGFIYHLD